MFTHALWETEKVGPRGGIWHDYPERDGPDMQGFAKVVQSVTPLTRAVFKFAEQVRRNRPDAEAIREHKRETPRYRAPGPRYNSHPTRVVDAMQRHFT